MEQVPGYGCLRRRERGQLETARLRPRAAFHHSRRKGGCSAARYEKTGCGAMRYVAVRCGVVIFKALRRNIAAPSSCSIYISVADFLPTRYCKLCSTTRHSWQPKPVAKTGKHAMNACFFSVALDQNFTS